MWLYWVMFLIPAWAAVTSTKKTMVVRPNRPWDAIWICGWLSLTLLIGLRDHVGGDWRSYLVYYDQDKNLDFTQVLQRGDPGFQLFNWLSAQVDFGVYGANLLGGAVFAYGLLVFCRNQPQPWVALAAAIPYLVIVVAMGYSRQAIALGLEMVGLTYLANQSKWKFAASIGLATTFHKTALVVLPIAALSANRNRLVTMLWISVAAYSLYSTFLEKDTERFYNIYVASNYQSEGAMIRTLMNAVPGLLFLIWRKKFMLSKSVGQLWTIIAWCSAALPLILLVSSASTAIDRMALYMLPIQLFVFARLPSALSQSDRKPALAAANGAQIVRVGKSAQQICAAILLYYALVLFVWLNFGAYSVYWQPYRFYPFE